MTYVKRMTRLQVAQSIENEYGKRRQVCSVSQANQPHTVKLHYDDGTDSNVCGLLAHEIMRHPEKLPGRADYKGLR